MKDKVIFDQMMNYVLIFTKKKNGEIKFLENHSIIVLWNFPQFFFGRVMKVIGLKSRSKSDESFGMVPPFLVRNLC